MDNRDSQRIKEIRDNTAKMADAFTRITDTLERLADRKTEPQKKEVEWVYNKRERLWYPYLNGELLFKTENSSEKPNNSKMEQVEDEPQTYITEDRDTQILDAWQVHHRNITTVEDEPTTERSSIVGEWLLDGRCSNCLQAPLTTHKNFCPNCGADMRQREE